MDDPIESIQRQTQRYWYVDGLNEIGAGALIFLLGVLYILQLLLSPSDLANMVTSFGQPMLIICGWFVVNWVVKRLKARLTYPRTGYVSYRRERGSRRTSAILVSIALAAGFAIAAVFLGQMVGEKIIPILIALMMAGAAFYLGVYFGLRRFYLVAAVALLLGAVCAWLNMTEAGAMALFFSGFGIAWVVSGAITLTNYLRQTQPAMEEDV